MIYVYGVSEQGSDHIKTGTVCQDAFYFSKLSKNLVIAGVADGLGSSEHSEIASNLAVKTAVEECIKYFKSSSSTPTDQDFLQYLRYSFNGAQDKIEEYVNQQNGHYLNQYDTTLTLAVLFDRTLYYGHTGDSGIIALTMDGIYEQVTIQQRDKEGRVFPLVDRGNWVFKKYDKEVASVLLATDGMLDTFFPNLLREEPVKIYVSLARFFMDNQEIKINIHGEQKATEQFSKFIHDIDPKTVRDDKTLMVLINADANPHSQPAEYYQSPNWPELKQRSLTKYNKEAYPQLSEEQITAMVQDILNQDSGDAEASLVLPEQNIEIPKQEKPQPHLPPTASHYSPNSRPTQPQRGPTSTAKQPGTSFAETAEMKVGPVFSLPAFPNPSRQIPILISIIAIGLCCLLSILSYSVRGHLGFRNDLTKKNTALSTLTFPATSPLATSHLNGYQCDDLKFIKLKPNIKALINQNGVQVPSQKFRDNPEGKYHTSVELNIGQIVSIIGGPKCISGITWWLISIPSLDILGWVQEFDPDSQTFFIVPVSDN